MRGIAGSWLVWSKRGEAHVTLAITLFGVQLGLNALWSWLFFGLQRPDFAFYEVVVFLLVLVATTFEFWGISPTAGKLMLPYVAWVGFAAFLNLFLWRMNPYTAGRT